eukprot:TRINITY_DN11425_c0_g1_i1.p1 TRINITY_DN11425_c0_g1~~TRINITY_DN11425_c0_g1_i1.p1  ORF type:complete len:312 (+),score=51.48 TRINITY_DN11425_c0_g1_i1:47-937(+)
MKDAEKLSPESIKRARESPWLPYIFAHYKKHKPYDSKESIIKFLAKYDDFEEDVYQALEIMHGERPEWPEGIPPKEAKLRPNQLRLTSSDERRMYNGSPITKSDFFRHGGTEQIWATLPLEGKYDGTLPLKVQVHLARHKHDPTGSPFCCTRCANCGVLLELLLDPGVMNYHEVRSQLEESRALVARLETQLRQSTAAAEVRALSLHHPTPSSNQADLQRLQWLLRESHERERTQTDKINMLSCKIVDLTHELQRQAERSGGLDTHTSKDNTIRVHWHDLREDVHAIHVVHTLVGS